MDKAGLGEGAYNGDEVGYVGRFGANDLVGLLVSELELWPLELEVRRRVDEVAENVLNRIQYYVMSVYEMSHEDSM